MNSFRLFNVLSSAVLLSLLGVQAKASATSVKHLKISGDNAEHGRYDIDYVQLVGRPSKPLSAADKKINLELAKGAQDAICDITDANGMESEVTSATQVTFVSDRLLAIKISGEYSCAGAAHPDGGNTAMLFDRVTGQQIDLITEQAPYTDTAPNKTTDSIRNFILDKMAKQAQLEKVKRQDHECDDRFDRANLSFNTTDVFLTPRALIVQSAEAHVSMACQFETVIPLVQLGKIVKSNSLLAELAKGAGTLR